MYMLLIILRLCSNYSATASCVLTTAKCPDTDPITVANWMPTKTFASYSCGDGKDGEKL